MKSRILCALVIGIFCVAEETRSWQDADTLKTPAEVGRSIFSVNWTGRRVVGVILSTLVPGTGQSYLGHTAKGAAFTLSTFGAGLMTGISENNVVGRNERLEELEVQYRFTTTFLTSNDIWNEMVTVKTLLDKDKKRRDLFLKITIALWVSNIVDIVFFTEDKGEKTFADEGKGKGAVFGLSPSPHNGVNAVVVVRF